MSLNFDLFIHGVPKGHSCWGKKEAQPYFDQFYNNSQENDTKFIVETTKINGKSSCCYSYVKYGNFVDVESRAGGYFGISLMFNMYCKDYNAIYTILESVYKNKVFGLLLQDNKSNIKYLVPDFISKDEEIKVIENDIGESIVSLGLKESFIAIDNVFQLQSEKSISYNPLDCTEEKILSAVKQYSKVIISDTILTNREKIIEQNCNKKVSEADKECNKKIEEAKQEMSRKIKQTETDYNKLSSDLKAKNAQLEQLNTSYKSATDDLSKIKGILGKYQSYPSDDQEEETNNGIKSRLFDDNWFKLVMLLLFLVVIAMQILFLFKEPTPPATEYPAAATTTLTEEHFSDDGSTESTKTKDPKTAQPAGEKK